MEEQKVDSIRYKLHPRKAPGPDALKGRVLKECVAQLSSVVPQLFQLFLNTSFIPKAWKETIIIFVPKKPHSKALKDFRPLAITSILCKCREKVVAEELTAMVGESLGLLQFAYMAKREVEDAHPTLLDTVATP